MRSSLPKAWVTACLNQQSSLCNHCNEPLNVKERLQEVDHKVPYSMVQRHELSNLQVLCLNCHRRKTTKDNQLIRIAKTSTEPVCFTCHRVFSKQFPHQHTTVKNPPLKSPTQQDPPR